MNYVDIFDIVVLSSLIGSIIVLLILSIKLMFKNRLTSTFQYYIWMILIIKLIVPFGPHYSFNVSNIYEKFHTENITNENTQETLTETLVQPQNTTSNSLISTNTTRSLDKNSTNNTSLKSKVNIKKASCDYQVISHLNRGENIQYGNTIIKILELSGSSRRLTGTTPMFTNSSEIKRRIIMISKYKKLSTRKILLGGMVIAAIAVLSIAINISNTSLHKTSSKFVNSLVSYIKHSSKIKTAIYYYDYGILYYNQDLSNKSVLVEIGNNWSNDKDIEDCVNAFVSALKHIAK